MFSKNMRVRSLPNLLVLLLSALFIAHGAEENTKPTNCLDGLVGNLDAGGNFYGSVTIKIETLCGAFQSVKNRVEDGVFEYLSERLACESGGNAELISLTMINWKRAALCSGSSTRQGGGRRGLNRQDEESVAKLNYVGRYQPPGERRRRSRRLDGIFPVPSPDGVNGDAGTAGATAKRRSNFRRPHRRGLEDDSGVLTCLEESGCASTSSSLSLADVLRRQNGFGAIERAKVAKLIEADCTAGSAQCKSGKGVCCGVPGCTCYVPSRSLCQSNGCCIDGADPGFCYEVGICGKEPCRLTRVDIDFRGLNFTADFQCLENKTDEIDARARLDVAAFEYFSTCDVETNEDVLFVDLENVEFFLCDELEPESVDDAPDEFSFYEGAETDTFGRTRRRLSSHRRRRTSRSRGRKASCNGCRRNRRLATMTSDLGDGPDNDDSFARRIQQTCDENTFLNILNANGFNVTNATAQLTNERSTVIVPIPTVLVDTICQAFKRIEGRNEQECLDEDDETRRYLLSPTTPQFKALVWLSSDPGLRSYDEPRLRQRFALATFFWSTNGLQLASNWMDYFVNECVWFGVSCDEDGRIIRLELPRELCSEGSLPREIGLIESMERIVLSFNDLGGGIPKEWGLGLFNLTVLDLYTNSLTDPIPSEVGLLTKLFYFDVGNNMIDGTIPTTIGKMAQLEQFWAENNQISGPLPSEMGMLTNLFLFAVYNNKIGGTLPSEIGNMSNLFYFSVDQNSIGGTIPSDLGRLQKLTWLYLSRNMLSGNIPPELGNLSSLFVFWLFENRLTGEIPQSFGQLTFLAQFYFYVNDLNASTGVTRNVCTLATTGTFRTQLVGDCVSCGCDICNEVAVISNRPVCTMRS